MNDPAPSAAPPPATLASRGAPPVRSEFLPISVPDIGPRERELVLQALESGWITTGPRSFELAERVAKIAGAKHAVALNSATGALHLALEALGIGDGDEVITTPVHVRGERQRHRARARAPVLVDIEARHAVHRPAPGGARHLAPRTRPSWPWITPAPVRLRRAARARAPRGIRIVDDAAHAAGRRLARDGRSGSAALADVTAFSFYATKNLTTGEGGAAETDDAELAERIRLLSLHGMNRDAWKRYGASGSWFYEITAPGWKYNLSDLLAAIGVAQLERFEASQQRRHELVARYTRSVRGVPEVRTPVAREGMTHAWHLYAISLELERLTIDRARFIEELRAENIGTSVHFIPIHLHPHFRTSLGLAEGALPVAEDAYRRAITLPLFARMTDRDVDDVVAAVSRIATAFRR